MNVARYLVQGVDVWLNNPRRPLEASGTSGMKVCVQRRPEPQHPRRLVGRRLSAGQRLGHRRRRGIHRPHLPGRRREPGHLRPARTGDRAAVLQPRRRTACRAAGSARMKRVDQHAMCRSSTPTAWCRNTSKHATGRRVYATYDSSATSLRKLRNSRHGEEGLRIFGRRCESRTSARSMAATPCTSERSSM